MTADWSVDLILSTACLHWVKEHELVLEQCRRHLKPGGRIFFQMGGRGNCAEILAAVEALAQQPEWVEHLTGWRPPWCFAGPEDYEVWLQRNGFRPVRLDLIPKDMVHSDPEALAGWMRTTWMPLLAHVPESRHRELIDAVVARHLRAHPRDGLGRTHVAISRLEVEAVAV